MAIELSAGQRYPIDVLAGSALFHTYIEGDYDADGNMLDDSANENHGYAGSSATSFVTPWENGTHYVGAGTPWDRLGTHTVEVKKVEDPHSADTGTTGMVSVNGAVSGAIGSVW